MDRMEALDMLEIMAVKRMGCPRCQEPLEYFSGLEHIPEYLFCPKCNDRAYNLDGERIAELD